MIKDSIQKMILTLCLFTALLLFQFAYLDSQHLPEVVENPVTQRNFDEISSRHSLKQAYSQTVTFPDTFFVGVRLIYDYRDTSNYSATTFEQYVSGELHNDYRVQKVTGDSVVIHAFVSSAGTSDSDCDRSVTLITFVPDYKQE